MRASVSKFSSYMNLVSLTGEDQYLSEPGQMVVYKTLKSLSKFFQVFFDHEPPTYQTTIAISTRTKWLYTNNTFSLTRKAN